ncbi:MAG: HEAT repeat domain-containing protein [Nitrospirae bacterium]|nr:HEAT repeat domain-containing protein [Nitrospirota bacterium]
MNPIKDDTRMETSELPLNKVAVKMAADVLQSLSKAIKALKLYPDNSPVRQKIISDVTSKFSNFLQENGDLILTVRPFEFLYMGEVVYSQQHKEDSLAFKFFGDGIRELAFSENLQEHELLAFIDVIQGNRERDDDDDIVTLMWEKEFKNIRYVVIEEGGETDGGQDTANNNTKNLFGSALSKDALMDAHKAENLQGQMHPGSHNQSAGVEHEIELLYGKPFGEIFVITPEEAETIKEEMVRESKINLFLDMLDILFLILEVEEDTDSYAEIMTYIETSIKTMIMSGDYTHAIESLNKIKTIAESEKENRPKHAESASGVIDALGNETFLQQFTMSMNASKADNFDEIYTILTMLNKKSILPMTNMLSSLEQMKNRHVVCDALAVLAKDDLDSVLNKLHDDNWYIVRNIVYVLGRIADSRVLSHINSIKDHREPRVRKEIIHTLSEINSDEAKNMLVLYLNDSDSSVRVSALKRLTLMGHRKAVSEILRIITSEAFDRREIFEKKELFYSLADLGSEDQLPFLKELLMKKSRLFGRARVDEMRLLSVHALRKMNVSAATDIIREGASSSDKVIRKICEDALRSAGRRDI